MGLPCPRNAAGINAGSAFATILLQGNDAPFPGYPLLILLAERIYKQVQAFPLRKGLTSLLIRNMRRKQPLCKLVNVPAAIHENVARGHRDDVLRSRILPKQR